MTTTAEETTAPGQSDGTLRIGARVKVSDNPGLEGPGIGYVDPAFAGTRGVIVDRGTVGAARGTWRVRRDDGMTARGVDTNYIHPDCLTVIDVPDESTIRVGTPGGEALGDALVADQRLTEAQARAERAERELEAFRDKVRTRLIEEADARGWCSEADDWLEDLGLEGRLHDYTVYVTASVTIPVAISVTARNADTAADQVEFRDVRNKLNEHLSSGGFDLSDFEVEEVNGH